MKIDSALIETELARNNITQKKLSEKSGISRQTLSTILRRGSAAPVTVYKLAAALQVDILKIAQRDN